MSASRNICAFAAAAIIAACGIASSAIAQPELPIREPGAAAVLVGDAARAKAIQLRLPLEAVVSGRKIALAGFVNNRPLYRAQDNLNAAKTISANKVQPGGSLAMDLTGAKVPLAIWDGGLVRNSHREFVGRVLKMDTGATDAHATHVCGTMIAKGVDPNAKGMSPRANVDSYDWDDDEAEMRDAAAASGMIASNHSYGFITGWEFDSTGAFGQGADEWFWFGDTSVSTVEDWRFGFYDDQSAAWDDIAFDEPSSLICKAAGNDRNDAGPGPGGQHFVWNGSAWASSTTTRSSDGGTTGFDTLNGSSTSKNVLVVGSVEDIAGGYSGASSVVISTFSSFGPTDDGRIKPDVVANGASLWSSNNSGDDTYSIKSGTSMATPGVTGAIGLIQERYKARFLSGFARSDLVRGILIHTADEAGANPGPDYKFGWGLVNVASACKLIDFARDDKAGMRILSITAGQTKRLVLAPLKGGVIKATVVWNDPAASVSASSLDPTARKLVNDLDAKIIRRFGVFGAPTTFSPWVLNPASPAAAATKGVNTRDNVEVVEAGAVLTGNNYTLEVKAPSGMSGSQSFSVIVTGATISSVE